MTLRWQQSQDRLGKGKPSSPPHGTVGNDSFYQVKFLRNWRLVQVGALPWDRDSRGRLQQNHTTLSAGRSKVQMDRWKDG